MRKYGKQWHMARLVSVVKSVAAVKWLFARGLETVNGWTIASRQYILDLFWRKLTLRVRSESLDRSLSWTLYVLWITTLAVRNFLPFLPSYFSLLLINHDLRVFLSDEIFRTFLLLPSRLRYTCYIEIMIFLR